MLDPHDVKPGIVVRHHSGRVYTVLFLANAAAPSERFPLTVVYQGANGNVWSRPKDEFVMKFSLLYGGSNLADN